MVNTSILVLLFTLKLIWKSTESASRYAINTYSGQLGTNIGDGELATNALIRSPSGLWGNSVGDIFVIEVGVYRIRKISGTFPKNITSTYIGMGTQSTSSLGIPATSTTVYSPFDLWGDTAGNLYYTDSGMYNCVRKCDAITTYISTVAGSSGGAAYPDVPTVATAAIIGNPQGIFGDTSNNIFFMDNSNNRLRKLDLISGIMVTFAGNAGGSVYNGEGLAATSTNIFAYDVWGDTMNNMYISEYSNYRIRRIGGPLSGMNKGYLMTFLLSMCVGEIYEFLLCLDIIFTVAGTGVGTLYGDGNAATSAGVYFTKYIWGDTANVYFTFLNFGGVRRINVAAGTINAFIGVPSSYANGFSGDGGAATSGQLSYAAGLFADSAGTMYVSDASNTRIRKRATDGILTTFAGHTINFFGDGQEASRAFYSAPLALFMDTQNSLFIADSNNYRVRKVSRTGIVSTYAGNGAFTDSGNDGPATSAGLGVPISLWGDTLGRWVHFLLIIVCFVSL